MKKFEVLIIIAILAAIAILFTGCGLEARVAKLEAADPNIIEALVNLMSENSAQHRKLGETDIKFHNRIKALEDQ